MKTISVSLLFLTMSIMALGQDAREISKKANDAIQMNAMEMVSTLKIISAKGEERVRTISTATGKFGEVSKTLIRFIEPAEVRGTTLLIFDYENKDDDMWIYMPALRKTRRIVSSEKGKYFMGSEFTNADMSKPSLDDFDYKLLGEETINNVKCWIIEASCKNESIAEQYGYSKKTSYIEKTHVTPQRIEYQNKDNEIIREQTFKDYRRQPSGNYFAFNMEMINKKNNRRSIIITEKLQSGSTLQESFFSASTLGQ